MSDHPSLHRNNIAGEFLASNHEGMPGLSRSGAREARVALKAWSKRHPNPISFSIKRNPKPDAK